MKSLFLCAMILSLSQTAMANNQTPESKAFREPARQVLKGAIAQGLTELNGINLIQVLERLDKIQIETAPQTKFVNRTSAFWQPMKITYNPIIFEEATFYVQHILTTHEVIGAVSGSWKDDSYSHAIYIFMTAYKPIFQSTLNAFKWPTNIGKPAMEAGGVTIVGGGGDVRDIDLKIRTLMALNLNLSGKEAITLDKSKDIPALIRAIILMNWYVSPLHQEGQFNIHAPKNKNIQPTILLHPNTYNMILKSNDRNQMLYMIQMAEAALAHL